MKDLPIDCFRGATMSTGMALARRSAPVCGSKNTNAFLRPMPTRIPIRCRPYPSSILISVMMVLPTHRSRRNGRWWNCANAYVQLLILPEIGGKIWAAIDKSTGKSFIYFNHVVKFRDVSMRGPWTSGGMEPNYGIMGHTPNLFTPVDYLARENPDGSASCFIGVLDLLTRTTWRLEINLPSSDTCFSTPVALAQWFRSR